MAWAAYNALVLACAAAAPAAADGLPRALRIGTSGDYAPFSVANDGSYAGFDVAVAERFAREAGFAVEWVRFRWPGLAADLAADRFDVAMSGVTWTPERATAGYLTRAVATSGPCVLGATEPERVGVNRGGFLETFARRRFPAARIRAVERNQSLPELLARDEVDAIVTDRFEIAFFRRGGEPEHCEPATDRKVYWVSPARAHDLGPRLDDWLARSEPAIAELRARWLKLDAPRTQTDHLVDLLARRLALMPAVARAKAARGLAVEDAARERRVVAAARRRAREEGLDADTVEALFRVQIALGKRVQERTPPDPTAPALDLETALRPAIGALGDRLVAALGAAAPLSAASLAAADTAPLAPLLAPDEQRSLLDALRAVRRAR